MQVEKGTSATSYIRTYGATATRSADVAFSNPYARAKDYAYIEDLDDWYNADNGTAYIDATALQNFEDGLATSFFALSDDLNVGTTNAVLSFHTSTTAGRIWTRSKSNSQNADSTTGNTIRYAASYDDTNVLARYVDGSQSTKSFLTLNAGSGELTKYLVFGDEVANGYEGNFCIKQFTYYPETLTSTNLEALVEE